MKKSITIVATLMIAISSFAQGTPPAQRGQAAQPGQTPFFEAPQLPASVAYSVRAGFGTRTAQGRSSNNAPTFFIFPDTKLDENGAKALVDQLGMQSVMDEHHASLYVINPSKSKYAASDYDVFEEVFNASRTGNAKVIGLGEGATFVNQHIAPKAAGYIAGILTYGGKPSSLRGNYPGVPAYVAGKTAKGEGITMEIGDLIKDGKPLIRCVAVMDYGHWNFKPTAQLMWDYFKMFSRDTQTKKLIYHGK